MRREFEIQRSADEATFIRMTLTALEAESGIMF